MLKFFYMENKFSKSSDSVSIKCLPNEVILMILKNNNCGDILNFGLTCRDFYDLVTANQHIWKEKYRNMFPKDIYDLAESKVDGDWFSEIKRYHTIKKVILTELLSMSSKYYWQNCEVALEELTFYFDIAFEHSMNVYYILQIFQHLVKKGNEYLKMHIGKKLHTMTDLYYAKIVLRHLIQTCLSVKWVQARMSNEMPPERLVNFFLQWVDMENMHWDEDITDIIKTLGDKVESVLQSSLPSKVTSSGSIKTLCETSAISEKQVLSAITEVIYKQAGMTVTNSADFDSIDIKKIFQNKCGNLVVVAAVYQAVAQLFGVKCKLIVFQKHLFLEWRSPDDPPNTALHTVDLETGQWRLKRQCPFSQNTNTSVKTCPESLLKYLSSAFLVTMGSIKNWNTQNAAFLLDFVSPHVHEENPYRNFLPYLLDNRHLPGLNKPFNMKNLSDTHLEILQALTKVNTLSYEPNVRTLVVKERDSCIKYAVGMVCYHREYQYACVIRDWGLICAVSSGGYYSGEVRGQNQPFYKVTAADQSDRYIVQDKLIDATHPTRLYTLEDIISAEFSHFNGFSYVPNAEKLSEYPHDFPIANMYASRAKAPRVAVSTIT